MTIRDYLRKRKARYLGIGVACLVATFALIVTHQVTQHAIYSHAALALMLGYLACVVLSRSIRCPRCKDAVGGYTSWLNLRTTGFTRRMSYCACCGVGFDEPVIPTRA